MITSIIAKLPMRNKSATKHYYINQLGFQALGNEEYDGYLMIFKENIELHFFEFKELDPKENYGQVYIKTNHIDELYEAIKNSGVAIHPNGHLETKPWGQREFSLLDPNHNLLTFGQSI